MLAHYNLTDWLALPEEVRKAIEYLEQEVEDSKEEIIRLNNEARDLEYEVGELQEEVRHLEECCLTVP